jgi:hypothetical protein
MSELLVMALVISFVAWLFWTTTQPRYVFVIRIHNGQPSVRKGRVTKLFLEHIATACQQGGVVQGWIGGVRQGRRTALRFSKEFPLGPQQMLRNEWVMRESIAPAKTRC